MLFKYFDNFFFFKVCLQFPDELLPDAPSVAKALTSHLGFNVYILGDTTYGRLES